MSEPNPSVSSRLAPLIATRRVAASHVRPPARRGTPEGQEIAARNFYRPIDAKVAAAHAKRFPKLNLFTIDEVFGGWTQAQRTHFNDGGVFDQIYTRK